MPELPEVETVVRDLPPHVEGHTIRAARAGDKRLRRSWSAAWERELVGRRVLGVRRRGKWILLDLSGGPCLVIHLGMTGQLTAVKAGEPLADHTHLVIDLGGGDQVRFRDIRRFGSATLFAGSDEVERFFRESKLGPEPFDLDKGYWKRRLAHTSRCLKAVLLDQRAVAGVGNIYADESLFEARLPPWQLGRDTTAGEAERLRRAIPRVLNRAIKRRGSSIRDYVGGSGLRGGYQDEFRVYGRVGQPCRRCGTPIRRTRLAGRSTCFCPKCQGERHQVVGHAVHAGV